MTENEAYPFRDLTQSCTMEEYWQRYTESYKEIAHALSRGGGLQAAVDLAGEFLGNPLSVSDPSQRILAISKNYYELIDPEKFQNDLDVDCHQSIVNKQLSGKSADFIRRTQRWQRINERPSPYLFTSHEIGEAGFVYANSFLDCAVRARGTVIAAISVTDYCQPFCREDLTYVSLLSDLISMELQKKDVFSENRGEDEELLLYDLLENALSDNLMAYERLENINKHLREYLYVAVFHRTDLEETDWKFSKILRSMLCSYFPGSMSVLYRDDLVVVIDMNGEHKGSLGRNESFMALLRDFHLKYGLSNRFYDIMYLRKYYDQAMKAIELGSMHKPQEQIYVYYHYAFFHTIDLCKEVISPRDLAHPVILRLAGSDDPQDKEILKTLYVWLRCDKDIARITKALNISRSTLYYRLNKLKEQIGRDLNDGDLIFQLMYSFKMYEYFTKYVVPSDQDYWFKEIMDIKI